MSSQEIARRSDSVQMWVQYMVLCVESKSEMLRRVKFFIELMSDLEKINDIYSMFDIYQALKHYSLSRLKPFIWDKLNKEEIGYMSKLYQEIFEISKLKKKINSKVLPCVPHLLYFREIRNYYEIYKNKMQKLKAEGSTMIAFDPCIRMNDFLSQIKRYQQVGYSYDKNYPLLKYLSVLPKISQEEIEALSYKVLPNMAQ